MAEHQGGCICGAVRYATRGDPARVTYCHCRFCQRATGGAYMVEPVFQKQDLTVRSGTAAQYAHVSEGSGKVVTINFCARCGTKLWLGFERFSDVVGVYGGTFDDPDWFPRDPATTKHIYLDVAQHGTVIPPGLDTFGEYVIAKDGSAVMPEVLDAPRVIMRR